MDTVDLIIDSATAFYNELRKDQYGRYHSWEHCYKCFNDARHVRKPNYKVHIPVVKELLKKKYDRLEMC